MSKSILWKNKDGELVTITPDEHKIVSIFYGNNSDSATVEYYDELAEQIKPSKQPDKRSEDEIESDLVNEICQKFEEIGIDTSEWEYNFGDGNFATDFIKLGVQSHLEKLSQKQSLVEIMEADQRDGIYENTTKEPVIDNLRDKFFKECVDRLLVWPRQFDALKEDNANTIFEWFKPYLKSNSEQKNQTNGQVGKW